MKKTRRSDARLLLLFGVLALLPLAIWACTDAGDAPSPPTGPATVYNPAMDQAGATITAVASNSTVNAGGTIGITAIFRDANGRPVEGAPLGVWPEAGDASAPYFEYYTNPTLTDANGQASIHIYVTPICPSDSYTFVVGTFPAWPLDGPFARAFVHVRVIGTAVPGLTITTPRVTGDNALTVGATGNYTASGSNCSNGDTVEYQFEADSQFTTGWGAGSTSFSWALTGTYNVRARARCATTTAVMSPLSPGFAVTVSP